MRKLLAFVVVSLSVLVVAPRVTGQGEKTPDYMPLKVGSKWIYKADFGGMSLTITQKVSKVEKKDGKDIASLEKEFGGMTITDQMSSTDKGVFNHSFNGVAIDTPFAVLRLPVKKGETWDAEFTVMGEKVKVKLKSEGEEEVTVPAGKYKAVVVGMEMEFMGQQIKAKSWYAANVGNAKQTFEFGAVSGSSELEKVELAK